VRLLSAGQDVPEQGATVRRREHPAGSDCAADAEHTGRYSVAGRCAGGCRAAADPVTSGRPTARGHSVAAAVLAELSAASADAAEVAVSEALLCNQPWRSAVHIPFRRAAKMAAQSADEKERMAIRRFAANPSGVRVTRTTQYDLLAHEVTKEEVCETIIEWIDGGQRVKKVTLRGQHAGLPAFEMKPRINDTLFYLKVALCEMDLPIEYMLLISAHPDH